MKLFRMLTAAVLAAAMCAQVLLPVSAEDITAEETAGAVLFDDPVTKDDPEYFKRLRQTEAEENGELTRFVLDADENGEMTPAAVYGSANLIHDSKFDGLTRSYCIDVSENQTWKGAINWEKVKAAGVTDVIVRLGYRGYGSAGTLCLDPSYYQNINGAKAAGLNVGVYFFTQAITEAEARAEADFCLKYLKGYSLELPVYFDSESIYYAYARYDHAGLTFNSRTYLARVFCDRIIAGGYKAGVYSSSWWLGYMMDGASLAKSYHVWVASYNSKAGYYNDYDMWQYSGYGWLDGVPTAVDLNVRYWVQRAPSGTPTASASGKALTWTGLSDAEGYVVYTRDSSGADAALVTVTGTSYTPSVVNGVKFYVRGYKKFAGWTYYSNASNLVSLYNGKVEDLKALTVTDSMAVLNWKAVTGAKSYEVCTVVNGKLSKRSSGTSTLQAVTKLDPESTYIFAVRAVLEDGSYGDASDHLTVTTLKKEVPVVTVLKGDIDGDGVVGASDGAKLNAHIAGNAVLTKDAELKAADIDGDGSVTAADDAKLIAYLKGIGTI